MLIYYLILIIVFGLILVFCISAIYGNNRNKNEAKNVVNRLERFDNNVNNYLSCEKEPNDNEIKLPVNDFFETYKTGIINSNVGRKLFDLNEQAALKGYNYFIISKSDYNELIKLNDKKTKYNAD